MPTPQAAHPRRSTVRVAREPREARKHRASQQPRASQPIRGWRYASPEILKYLAGLKPGNQDYVLRRLGLRCPPLHDTARVSHADPVPVDPDLADSPRAILHGWRYAAPEMLERLAVRKPENQDFVLRRLGLVRPLSNAWRGGWGVRPGLVRPPQHFQDGGETPSPRSPALPGKPTDPRSPAALDPSVDPTMAAGVVQPGVPQPGVRQPPADLSADPTAARDATQGHPTHPTADPFPLGQDWGGDSLRQAFRKAGETLEPQFMQGTPAPRENDQGKVGAAPATSAVPAPVEPRTIPRMYLHYLSQSGEPLTAVLPKIENNPPHARQGREGSQVSEGGFRRDVRDR